MIKPLAGAKATRRTNAQWFYGRPSVRALGPGRLFVGRLCCGTAPRDVSRGDRTVIFFIGISVNFTHPFEILRFCWGYHSPMPMPGMDTPENFCAASARYSRRPGRTTRAQWGVRVGAKTAIARINITISGIFRAPRNTLNAGTTWAKMKARYGHEPHA